MLHRFSKSLACLLTGNGYTCFFKEIHAHGAFVKACEYTIAHSALQPVLLLRPAEPTLQVERAIAPSHCSAPLRAARGRATGDAANPHVHAAAVTAQGTQPPMPDLKIAT
jgi:hypothetical protein